jgi:hypothetical protein
MRSHLSRVGIVTWLSNPFLCEVHCMREHKERLGLIHPYLAHVDLRVIFLSLVQWDSPRC